MTELRVHGVSGTPPEAMLGVPTDQIKQVAGDSAAGFYRPVAEPDPGRPLEVYAWGGLTSGPGSRALWLLFMPFILINLAHWMLPAQSPRSRGAGPAGRLSVRGLRLIGLSLTLTLLCALVLTVLDVTMWQCGALTSCAAQWGPLAAITHLARGQQLAVAAVPVALAIIGILVIGRANPTVPQGSPPEPTVMRGDVPLADPAFWASDPSVGRLRSAHVMAWTSALAVLTLWPAASYGGASRMVTISLIALNVVILLVAVVATASNRVAGRGGAGADRLSTPLQIGQWASLAVLAGALAWVAWAPATYPPPPTQLPGLRGAVYLLLAAQIVLLVMVFTAAAVARGSGFVDGFAPMLRGFAAPFAATIALLIGGGFSVGIAALAALVQGDPVGSTEAAVAAVRRGGIPLIIPPTFFWAAIMFVVVLVILVVVVLAVWLTIRRRARAGYAGVLAEYEGDETPAERRRAQQVSSARSWAQATELVIPIAAGMALLTLIAVAVLLVAYAMPGVDGLPAGVTELAKVSVVAIAAAAALLIGLTLWALSNRQIRRTVGVLWDVATFWPRANHPLTPPCYAERAVPELLERLSVLSHDDGAVVLAAHSQGSIIAAASLLQAGIGAPRVALLTFGSPLRRLYARGFPAYFGRTPIGRLHDLWRWKWINLWALTDPIGSWVLCSGADTAQRALDEVDYHLRDVTSLAPGDDGGYPPICGHSGFWTRPEYAEAFGCLAAQVVPGTVAAQHCPGRAPAPESL